jgi:hypothetical protein
MVAEAMAAPQHRRHRPGGDSPCSPRERSYSSQGEVEHCRLDGVLIFAMRGSGRSPGSLPAPPAGSAATREYQVVCWPSAVAGDDQVGLRHVSAPRIVFPRVCAGRPGVTGCLGLGSALTPPASRSGLAFPLVKNASARLEGLEPPTGCLEGGLRRRCEQPNCSSQALFNCP